MGLRHQTAVALTPRHLATGRIVTVTKRGRVVTLPVTPRLAALADIAEPHGSSPVTADCRFVDLLNNRVVIQGKQTIGQRWQRWKTQAGLPRNLRLHDLRRDCAHRVYATSKDVRQVQGLLGHESPVTSLRYLHLAAPMVEPQNVTAALLPERE